MKLKNTASVLFWNVDTQNDFMKASGKLYVQDAEEIELTLERLTRFAKKYNIKVLNTCDFHNEKTIELSSTPDFIATFPPHCMENTEGQDFVMATKPDIAVVFVIDTFVTFGAGGCSGTSSNAKLFALSFSPKTKVLA